MLKPPTCQLFSYMVYNFYALLTVLLESLGFVVYNATTVCVLNFVMYKFM